MEDVYSSPESVCSVPTKTKVNSDNSQEETFKSSLVYSQRCSKIEGATRGDAGKPETKNKATP